MKQKINSKLLDYCYNNPKENYICFSYTINREVGEHWSLIKFPNLISMYCFHPINEYWASQLILKDLNILYSYGKSKKIKIILIIYNLYIISILYRK